MAAIREELARRAARAGDAHRAEAGPERARGRSWTFADGSPTPPADRGHAAGDPAAADLAIFGYNEGRRETEHLCIWRPFPPPHETEAIALY